MNRSAIRSCQGAALGEERSEWALASEWFLFGRGSKAVKCAWFRSKSFGFASSILALFSFAYCLTGAMVARLPTEQEVVGSIPTLGLVKVALLAQSVEHATFNRGVGGSSPPQGFLFRFGVLAQR